MLALMIQPCHGNPSMTGLSDTATISTQRDLTSSGGTTSTILTQTGGLFKITKDGTPICLLSWHRKSQSKTAALPLPWTRTLTTTTLHSRSISSSSSDDCKTFNLTLEAFHSNLKPDLTNLFSQISNHEKMLSVCLL